MMLSWIVSCVVAWPVDMIHDVEVGHEKFVAVSAVDWAQAETESIAKVEVMEAGEVLITGLKPGRTIVLLHAEGRFAVWRVRVGNNPATGSVDRVEGVKRDCPGIEVQMAPDPQLRATLNTEKCWSSLHQLLQSDLFVARKLELVFDGKILQFQLKRIFAQLPRTVSAKYVGAGLVLDGTSTPGEHQKTLWMIFHNSVGRVPLIDQVELSADAGVAPAPR